MIRAGIILILFVFLLSCSYLRPHRISVQQGNILEQETINKLELGMSKDQVLFIMGTPMLMDPYHFNRWDYIHTIQEGYQDMQQQRFSLFFEDDELVRVAGDFRLGAVPAEKEVQDDVLTVPLAAGEDDTPWWQWLKFWGNNERHKPQEPEPNDVNYSSRVQEIIDIKKGDRD